MRYELLLQSAAPDTPYDARRVEALLLERGASPEEGGLVWRLPSGRVEVRPLRENGNQVATELRIPLADGVDLARELVSEGVALAAAANVALVDPQLCRAVVSPEDSAVIDQYVRTAKYAGEMVGISEAIGAGEPAETGGIKPGTKVLLALVGFFFLLYLIADRLSAR